MVHEGCSHMQVLEVLHKASQAVKVTWKTDELDKENTDPMPASGAQRAHSQAALLARISNILSQQALEHPLAPSLLKCDAVGRRACA